MPKVRSTRIRGKPVGVHTEPIVGYCVRKGDPPEIYIDPRESVEDCSYTAFHEFIHAWFPDLAESQVQQIEREWRSLHGRLFTVQKKDGAW